MRYTHLVHFEDDQFVVSTTTTVKEAKELSANGSGYITEKNGIMLLGNP